MPPLTIYGWILFAYNDCHSLLRCGTTVVEQPFALMPGGTISTNNMTSAIRAAMCNVVSPDVGCIVYRRCVTYFSVSIATLEMPNVYPLPATFGRSARIALSGTNFVRRLKSFIINMASWRPIVCINYRRPCGKSKSAFRGPFSYGYNRRFKPLIISPLLGAFSSACFDDLASGSRSTTIN